MRINGIIRAATFWHRTDGKWVYTGPLSGNAFDVTAKVKYASGGDERLSWGHEAPTECFIRPFDEFAPPIKQLLELVKYRYVQKFDFFTRDRLNSVIDTSGSIALGRRIASTIQGVRGRSGACARRHSRPRRCAPVGEGRSVLDGPNLSDRVRSPRHSALYKV
ncbi:hypothetical protein F5Y13DRAFT_202259 [Hypoxylon sp. FL1857]|nr:hypothetical protein F5Y13DRAFT_202259 [Hypoxylon sp. FL1857]